ncbi:hypothetical protein BCO18430_02002 [Burkholderia contaminans]|uniref:hypothetical protein n=1 Tax=Burkholderia contaminans TaxID=488447 RepID=UPI0014541484|nr:hypothetical protein [Burkholderia contaminans]VWC72255.1 hypothetical protein BCO18430_02002 [Burkholderia contaminans]
MLAADACAQTVPVPTVSAATDALAVIVVRNGPFGIAVIPDGKRVYVTRHSDTSVAVIAGQLQLGSRSDRSGGARALNHPAGTAGAPSGDLLVEVGVRLRASNAVVAQELVAAATSVSTN